MQDLKIQITLEDLYIAWHRVKEKHAHGGCDGLEIDWFVEHIHLLLKKLLSDLNDFSYHPLPLVRVVVPKKHSHENRFLCLPTIRDKIVQAVVLNKLNDIFEKEFETESHGFRKHHSVNTAIEAIEYWRDRGYHHVCDADIKNCFDSINHHLLLKKLYKLHLDPYYFYLFKKWISAEVYDGERVWSITKGLPQGTLVSPMLANLYLDQFDEYIKTKNYKLIRYADDFVVLCNTGKQACTALDDIKVGLKKLKLSLNEQKTNITTFEAGFQFLGAIFLNNDVMVFEPDHQKEKHHIHFPNILTLEKYIGLKHQFECGEKSCQHFT